MSNYTEIRCPYCLIKRKIPTQFKSKIKCVKCSRQFWPNAALVVGRDELANIPMESENASSLIIIVFLLTLVVSNGYVYQNTAEIKGGAFILGYIIFGVFCVLFSRLNVAKIKTFLLVLFESVGMVRLYVGFHVGMSDFGFLFFAMFIGGSLIYADSLSDFFSNSGNSGNGGCGGGGGCGSGCGGGCGGCG